MLGICYLALCVMLGREFVNCVCSGKKRSGENVLWLLLPAWFGTGTLFVTWMVYLASWLLRVCGKMEQPLLGGNLTAAVLAVGGILALRRRRRKIPMIRDRRLFHQESVLFGILAVFLTVMMFYVFHVSGGYLFSGFTVFGDYAPHTAMMRSFSWGNNFPTQYPHFGGEDVKYHFMFQFLGGNLEYLGLRIDVAFNLISILSLLGFLMLLYTLAVRIFRRFSVGVLAIVFFFFRSAASFFRFAWEHLQAGDLWQTLTTNTTFIGYTPNENWGLWNFNVYLNQRHLAFGLLLAALAILFFWDWLEAGCVWESKGICWIKDLLFTRESWRSRSLETAIFVGMFLGLGSFWNGAAVIGALLILCGMAFFSRGKLDYLIMAVVAVVLSLLQTKIFIRGSALSTAIQWGFLAEDKSLLGILEFLFWMSGIFFLALPALAVLVKRRERCLLLSFLMPFVFAFTMSLTPDIAVNHKYIMISYAFLGILWSWAVCSLFSRKNWGVKAASVLLAVALTITGVYDFVVILLDNGRGHRVAVNMDSDLTLWLKEHTDSQDLLLTPEYSMNEVTLAGVMLYCGWPYYAWSAGYDTYYRADMAVRMYTTSSGEELKKLVEQEGITYILYEENAQFEGRECQEGVIAGTYPLVYTSQDGRIRIYET